MDNIHNNVVNVDVNIINKNKDSGNKLIFKEIVSIYQNEKNWQICIERIVQRIHQEKIIKTKNYPNFTFYRKNLMRNYNMMIHNSDMMILSMEIEFFIKKLQDRYHLRFDQQSLNTIHVKLMLKHLDFTNANLCPDKSYNDVIDEEKKLFNILYDFRSFSFIYKWYKILNKYSDLNLRK